jgi:hypothetical protein
MTIVEGQIETLKKLKESLHKSGVTKFGSIGEINRFLDSYDEDRKKIASRVEKELEAELREKTSLLIKDQKSYDEKKSKIEAEVGQAIQDLEVAIGQISQKRNSSFIYKVLCFFKARSLSRRRGNLEKKFGKLVEQRTKSESLNLSKLKREIENLVENKEEIVSTRCENSQKELDHAKQVIDGLYTLVAGAIGETSVVKTLQQLPDDCFLINDYSAKFDPPIYNKREKDKILSIQIDHLLVCPSGVFLLETKNWSKSSVDRLDLRSPVKQILRTSFALFVLLNSASSKYGLRLKKHHWGSKKVPIRNVIVMTNEKPKEEFKHVKVLALRELLGYINYFDQTLDPEDVQRIFEYLKQRMRKYT